MFHTVWKAIEVWRYVTEKEITLFLFMNSDMVKPDMAPILQLQYVMEFG